MNLATVLTTVAAGRARQGAHQRSYAATKVVPRRGLSACTQRLLDTGVRRDQARLPSMCMRISWLWLVPQDITSIVNRLRLTREGSQPPSCGLSSFPFPSHLSSSTLRSLKEELCRPQKNLRPGQTRSTSLIGLGELRGDSRQPSPRTFGP